MGVIQAVNLIGLAFAPHIVYFYATQLSEYGVGAAVIKGALVHVATAAVKMVLFANFLPGGADMPQLKDLVQFMISLVDVIGVWFAIAKVQHRNISNSHKYQAVGLGWAFADSAITRFFPLLLGSRSPEFEPSLIVTAIASNVVLIRSFSFASVGTMIWNKKYKSPSLLVLLRFALLVHCWLPIVAGIIEVRYHINTFQSLVLETAATALCALSAWQAYKVANPKAVALAS